MPTQPAPRLGGLNEHPSERGGYAGRGGSEQGGPQPIVHVEKPTRDRADNEPQGDR